MRQFEQEIGGGRPNFNVPGGPHPNFGIRPNFSGPGGFARPAFMPSSVMRSSLPIRGQAIPPPPSYARPEVVHHPTDRPGKYLVHSHNFEAFTVQIYALS